MPRTPVLERPSSLRVLGVGFVALLVFFVWLTYAFFEKKFVDSVPVTMKASNVGLSLGRDADVKLRGMIVGQVREVETDGDGVTMQIAMDPDAIDSVPADVSARIVPKTLFGEKYVQLIAPEQVGDQVLQAGDVIERAEVPIEVETLLNNLYPVLEAVSPEDLGHTLSALSTALEGRGEKLGDMLVDLDAYLQEINPEVPRLIDDVEKLGTVADTYAAAMPDLGRLLSNAVVTGDTIVAKRSQLAAFFQEGDQLSGRLDALLRANEDNLVDLPALSREALEITAEYSKAFPCFLEGMANIIPKLDDVYRDNTVHIKLELLPLTGQPTGYEKGERAALTRKSLQSPLTDPTCLDLPNPPYDQENPFPGGSAELYELIGLEGDHNKFRAPAGGLGDAVQPSVVSDGPAERAALDTLLQARLGLGEADVPDVGGLLLSPVVRGAEVRVDEAR
ncbi:MCE family protein [Aeromicrobium massiliense]|uniref:MCE family protein n=1 Tax=Aeromicrobium massiliense TaxID=1464554 RepID=UPI0005786F2B|nr:MCE family protein [Aeromicrobium massiliense]